MEFFSAAAPLAPILRGGHPLRVWADGNDACAFFEMRLEMPLKTGAVLASEWYRLRDGKVASIQLVFDTAAFRTFVPAR